ncbi:MAG TPA: tricarballylate/proton symporter TcuC, partial [Micropepsaceae bacterium]|nr:tricarballylate/proton symporter TcuC [Micropepsaceae bacterium]
MLSPAQRQDKIKAVLRVSAGNFLEMYDFIIYGYYARYIADTFFPGQNEFLRLMLSLMTFGAGFLMRPFGAVVLGAYMDRVGRRKGLLLALALMGAGTLSIAVTPGYAQIGVIAPLLIIAGRLLQGFSAGVQIGGCSVYLAEIATPGNRGFYCSWQSGSQQVAVMLSAALGVALTYVLPPETMSVWGWRVPILIGCLIVPLVFWLRHSLEETEEFAKSCPVQSSGAVMKLLSRNWQIVVVGAMLSILTTTTFYLITVYTPTFGSQVLHLDPVGNMLVTLCVGLSNFIWLPIGGALSDRIGGRPLLFAVPMAALLTAYPAMSWLVADPSFGKLLMVELWFSVIFGLYNGAMIPMLAEIVPAEVRAAAFALAYSLATAIFGGFTPAVS